MESGLGSRRVRENFNATVAAGVRSPEGSGSLNLIFKRDGVFSAHSLYLADSGRHCCGAFGVALLLRPLSGTAQAINEMWRTDLISPPKNSKKSYGDCRRFSTST